MTGKAYLVGAGPGRADLITVRGLRLLQRAEVVVYDRLVAQELMDEVPPEAERIFVGKLPGHHVMPQEKISQVLVNRVAAGKQVVRLKGGDPFVFGRGGEEAIALKEAGLPYEIVPGVTSSIAVPAFAGIPVTQRNVATAFAVVTGHTAISNPKNSADWAAVAHVPTIVIMMGVTRIAQSCADIIAAGRDPNTPAAAISHGTTDQQHAVTATLGTLPLVIKDKKIKPPTVIVVGEVAAYADQLAWFEPDGKTAGFPEIREESPVFAKISR
ncbi:MAG: uroporphyrinogen-III C-methyltransferase [Chloroflexi bacterium]|nr:MAG: uroporphyrinogen-III C-methyltransferase [Chloroflexota bacterium]